MGKKVKSTYIKIIAGLVIILSFITAGLNCVGVSERAPQEIETIEVVYNFSEPRIEKVDGEYYSIRMEDTQKYYDRAGLPLIPFLTAMIPIPQGRGVETIDIVPGKKVVIEGRFKIEYARQQTPIWSDLAVETGPDNEVYGSTKPFPGELYSVVSTQYQRGSEILILNLYPVEYIPFLGGISYYEKMKVIVTTVPAG
jgi:hypothetical protein